MVESGVENSLAIVAGLVPEAYDPTIFPLEYGLKSLPLITLGVIGPNGARVVGMVCADGEYVEGGETRKVAVLRKSRIFMVGHCSSYRNGYESSGTAPPALSIS